MYSIYPYIYFIQRCPFGRLALARIRARVAAGKIQDAENPISCMVANGGAHPVTKDLLSAIRRRDLDGFAQCANRVQNLETQRQRLQDVDEYLSKLRRLLPQFTDSLEQTCNEPYWEERIHRIDDAWHWGQARYWIEDYIRQEDFPALARRAKQIEDQINNFACGRLIRHSTGIPSSSCNFRIIFRVRERLWFSIS